MFEKLRNFCANADGAGLVEYCLLAALIAAACVGAVTALGNSIQGLLSIPGW